MTQSSVEQATKAACAAAERRVRPGPTFRGPRGQARALQDQREEPDADASTSCGKCMCYRHWQLGSSSTLPTQQYVRS